MAGWPNGRLDLFAGAEHEIMMELPEVRDRFLTRVCEAFAGAAG